MNFQMFKLDLEKAEEPEIKLPISAVSLKKQESSRKTSTSALLTMPKPSTVWITINCGKFWKRWGYQTTWPASWETCMQVRKQQLVPRPGIKPMSLALADGFLTTGPPGNFLQLTESESHSVVSDSLQPHGLYTVHGILQARILEGVAFPFSRGSSHPRDRTQVSLIAGGFFTSWATNETQEYLSG